MAVLGKQPQAYQHYAALIRREYQFVPQHVYCSKRAEILESFASSLGSGGVEGGNIPDRSEKTVFFTSSMRDAFEETAIQNLREEIASLKRGQIPKELNESI